MVRFHQIRELVRWVVDYHARLKGMYSEKASSGEISDRLRMALEYVAEHEGKMQSELAQYLAEDSIHRGVLDTWFEEAVELAHVPMLDEPPEILSTHSVQDVLDTSMASHRLLQDLYNQRAQHAVSAAERELFNSLSEQYEAEIRRLARNMQRLEDY